MNLEERINLQECIHRLEGLLAYAEQTNAAPSVAPPAAFGCLRATRSGCPRVPAAPVPQQDAKGRKLTFVQGEFRW